MKKVIYFLIFLFCVAGIHAQSFSPWVVATSGGFFSVQDISLSWTIGEPVSETFTTSEYHLTQGFQQDFPSLYKVNEKDAQEVSISVYPNPVLDLLYISSEHELENASVTILNSDARVVLATRMDGDMKIVNVSSLPSGLYMVSLSINSELRTYKIFKY